MSIQLSFFRPFTGYIYGKMIPYSVAYKERYLIKDVVAVIKRLGKLMLSNLSLIETHFFQSN